MLVAEPKESLPEEMISEVHLKSKAQSLLVEIVEQVIAVGFALIMSNYMLRIWMVAGGGGGERSGKRVRLEGMKCQNNWLRL